MIGVTSSRNCEARSAAFLFPDLSSNSFSNHFHTSTLKCQLWGHLYKWGPSPPSPVPWRPRLLKLEPQSTLI